MSELLLQIGIRFSILYFVSDILAKFILVLMRIVFGEVKPKALLFLSLLNLVFLVVLYFLNNHFYSEYQITWLYQVVTYIWIHGMLFTFNFVFHGISLAVKR